MYYYFLLNSHEIFLNYLCSIIIISNIILSFYILLLYIYINYIISIVDLFSNPSKLLNLNEIILHLYLQKLLYSPMSS